MLLPNLSDNPPPLPPKKSALAACVVTRPGLGNISAGVNAAHIAGDCSVKKHRWTASWFPFFVFFFECPIIYINTIGAYRPRNLFYARIDPMSFLYVFEVMIGQAGNIGLSLSLLN